MLNELIEKYGYAVQIVEPDPEEADRYFAYTIGLFEKYEHPEMFVFAFGSDNAKNISQSCGSYVKEGNVIYPNEINNDLANLASYARPIHPSNFEEFLGIGMEYYGHKNFPALQLFWPNKDGLFPWDEQYTYTASVEPQPKLYLPENELEIQNLY
jgi:hypothetical protein